MPFVEEQGEITPGLAAGVFVIVSVLREETVLWILIIHFFQHTEITMGIFLSKTFGS